MIDAAKREAYNAGAATPRRAFEERLKAEKPSAASAPQATRSEQPAPTAPSADPLAIIKLRDDFDDATADLNLPAAQRKFLREQVMTNRPADVAGYVRQFVDVWRPANASNVTPNPAPASPPAVAPPSPMPGGTPPAAPVVTNDTPVLAILRSDPSQVDRLAADLGPAKFADRVLAEFRKAGVRVRVR